MLSIFNKVNSLDINVEYQKILNELFEKRFNYNGSYYPLFRFLDVSNQFKRWKYRDTIMTTTEYLEHIDILEKGNFKDKLTEVEFLYFIEFTLNMMPFTRGHVIIQKDSDDLIFLLGNIKLVIEKMGYELRNEEDKTLLVRKDADVDSVVDIVDEELQSLIIKYKDFRIEKDVFEKSSILKKLDLYIEKYKKLYKEKDNATYSLINKIVNNFDVNHPIKEKTDIDDEKDKILEAYDDCFLLMLHLIRSVEFDDLKKKYSEIFDK